MNKWRKIHTRHIIDRYHIRMWVKIITSCRMHKTLNILYLLQFIQNEYIIPMKKKIINECIFCIISNQFRFIAYKILILNHIHYAELGASLQQQPFWSIVVGGLYLLFLVLSLVVVKILWADENWFSSIITLLQYPM